MLRLSGSGALPSVDEPVGDPGRPGRNASRSLNQTSDYVRRSNRPPLLYAFKMVFF